MVALPICRWRHEFFPGQYICKSANFCNSPNVVTAGFCKKCGCADHAPLAPLPNAMPCVHLGKRERNGARNHRGEEASPNLYACALHGKCRIEGAGPDRPTLERSCTNCADYLARDPFGPDSTAMRHRAEQHLAAIPVYPKKRFRGRGVVIAGGGERFFPALYITVRALRHVGCTLPIQIWYLGREREMPDKKKALLSPFHVEYVDADEVRRRHPARFLDGWELKVFATLHSPFEEILFLDADCYPCRNP